MKFDPSLMRDILLQVETIEPDAPASSVQSDSHPQVIIDRHLTILIDEGFIEGRYLRNRNGIRSAFHLVDLTMKGHQFLANARNDTVWKKVIAKAEESGQSVALTVLNGLLEKAAQKYAGLE